MKSLRPTKHLFTKKRVIIAVCILLLIIVGISAWYLLQNKTTNQGDASRPVNSVDYSGPTEEEKEAGNAQKEANEERERLDQQPASSNAQLILTDASQYDDTIEVRAYAPNIYESTGTCTAVFSKAGGTTFAITSTAFTDAKTTQCGALNAARSAFDQAGTWSVVVSYKSATASGSTSPKDIIIK